MKSPAIYLGAMVSAALLAQSALTESALAGSAPAGGLDGKGPAICATTETFDCGPGRECIADSPEGVNVPRLFRLDFAAKKAMTKTAGGEERTAEIGSVTADGGEILLQGIQNGYGWTMAISQDAGAMTLTIGGKGAGFVIFGTCMPL